MKPEEVPAEWVEAAGQRVYDEEGYLVSARVLTLALAAVLPLAQAAALNEAAVEVLALGSISGSRVEVGRRAASWLGQRAARLREGSPS